MMYKTKPVAHKYHKIFYPYIMSICNQVIKFMQIWGL